MVKTVQSIYTGLMDEWTKEFAEQKYIKALDGEILLDNSRYIIDAQERFSVNDSFLCYACGNGY